jgi:hypothetical protein
MLHVEKGPLIKKKWHSVKKKKEGVAYDFMISITVSKDRMSYSRISGYSATAKTKPALSMVHISLSCLPKSNRPFNSIGVRW